MSDIEEPQEEHIVGPGELLKQAREKSRQSIEQIANKLHLKAAVIEDIEGDCLDESISVTFSKGYLKLYAKHVGADEVAILAAYDQLNRQSKEPAKLQSFSRRVARQANDDRLMLVTYLIVGLVAAMVVVWWFQQTGDNEPSTVVESSIVEQSSPAIAPQTSESAPSVQILSEQTPELASQSNDDVLEEATEQPQIDAQSPKSDLLEPTSTELSQDPQVLQDDPEATELVFTFSADCWINLVDASGEAIAYGIKDSGRVMTVQGIAPFVVTLGAPEAVQISYNGEAVNMTRFPAGKTAKFNLPLPGL